MRSFKIIVLALLALLVMACGGAGGLLTGNNFPLSAILPFFFQNNDADPIRFIIDRTLDVNLPPDGSAEEETPPLEFTSETDTESFTVKAVRDNNIIGEKVITLTGAEAAKVERIEAFWTEDEQINVFMRLKAEE